MTHAIDSDFVIIIIYKVGMQKQIFIEYIFVILSQKWPKL